MNVTGPYDDKSTLVQAMTCYQAITWAIVDNLTSILSLSSTDEAQALQLIAFVVFGAIASCILIHLLRFIEQKLVCKFAIVCHSFCSCLCIDVCIFLTR